MTRAHLYTLLRRAHLYTGLALLSFVVMYFVTGYPMIHEGLMDDPDPVVDERSVGVSQPPAEPLEPYAAWLQQELDLPGKRTQRRSLNDGTHRFEYWRPGTLHTVVVAADGATATVTTRTENARDVLVGFHRLHGYGGGWLYDMWVLFYDLASLSMIVFALTGIYLWWRLTKRRFWGWLCLGLSWGYAAVTVGWLLWAP